MIEPVGSLDRHLGRAVDLRGELVPAVVAFADVFECKLQRREPPGRCKSTARVIGTCDGYGVRRAGDAPWSARHAAKGQLFRVNGMVKSQATPTGESRFFGDSSDVFFCDLDFSRFSSAAARFLLHLLRLHTPLIASARELGAASNP